MVVLVNALEFDAGLEDAGLRTDVYFLACESVGVKTRGWDDPEDEIELKWRTGRAEGAERLKKKCLPRTKALDADTLATLSTAGKLDVPAVLDALGGPRPRSVQVRKLRLKSDLELTSLEGFEGALSYEICVCTVVSDPASRAALAPRAEGQDTSYTWISCCVERHKEPAVLARAGKQLASLLPPSIAQQDVFVGGYSAWLATCVQPLLVPCEDAGAAI